MLCLGLDTSAYTTSAALCRPGEEPLSLRRLLPVPRGERGLRQSEAVFAHVRQMEEVLIPLLRQADEPLTCVCASVAPRDGEASYMPVFRVGVTVGQAAAAAAGVPFYATTHQRGHIAAARYGTELKSERFLAVHLSGGTTDVLLCEGDTVTPLGASVDLHAGQLVDRVGVALGLPFPAGPHLEALARQGRAAHCVPVSMEPDSLCCHLSGAETRLLGMIRAGAAPEDIASEVYSVLGRTVLRLLSAAAEKTGTNEALLAGGVASSALMREQMTARNEKRRLGLRLHFGRPELSGDNAVGVALIGMKKWMKEQENGGHPGW